VQLRQGVAEHRAEQQVAQGDQHGDGGRVEERLADVHQGQQLAEVVQRPGGGDPHRGAGAQVRLRLEGGQTHPDERRGHHQQSHAQQRVRHCPGAGHARGGRAAGARGCGFGVESLHRVLSFSRRSWSSVTASTTVNSTYAMALAEPMWKKRKPSSYMCRETVSVLSSGPPSVITNGSSKTLRKPMVVITET